MTPSRTVRVAAVQAEGYYFNPEASVEKANKLIESTRMKLPFLSCCANSAAEVISIIAYDPALSYELVRVEPRN